jgi:hypothetical protein
LATLFPPLALLAFTFLAFAFLFFAISLLAALLSWGGWFVRFVRIPLCFH